MNNIYDRFYEVLHKNKQRRRKMFSLLLVLSLFTSTGVVWALRDVGITMVNEDLTVEEVLTCGMEEHTHSEGCFNAEGELICTLSEHIHTDDCYTNLVLLCEEPDHEHDLDCYAIPQHIGDSLMMANEGVEIMADGDKLLENQSKLYTGEPNRIQTIDNIARGINITMFDYKIFNNNTDTDYCEEDTDNNFDYNREYYNHQTHSKAENINDIDELDAYNGNYSDSHPNVNYSGINKWKNWHNNDLLFLVYGTPKGTVELNPENSDLPKYKAGTPGINNYSGDYQKDSYQSGNRPVQGIVQSNLNEYKGIYSQGFPKIANWKGTESDAYSGTLDYLFNNTEYSDSSMVCNNYTNGIQHNPEGKYKYVYTDTNYLLKEQNGHLIYDSNSNYAYLDTDHPSQKVYNGEQKTMYDFRVYDRTFDIVNEDHDGDGFKIGFFPYDKYNETYNNPNWNNGNHYYSHHFGMRMDAKFRLPSNTSASDGEPITFSYSGDDDMWVFIDGQLVLDIGGIHEPCAGMIDFTNGLVWVQDNATNPPFDKGEENKSRTFNELESYISSLIGRQVNLTDGSFPTPKFGFTTHGGEPIGGNRWIVRPITDFIENWNSIATTQDHRLDMFYLERGGCYSNLSMDMNLPTVGTLKVTKDVDFGSHPDDTYDDKAYRFGVYKSENGGPYTLIQQNGKENPFTLKAGESEVFTGLSADSNVKYKVVEYSDNMSIIDNTIIRGVDIIDPHSGFIANDAAVESKGQTLTETPSYIFRNTVRDVTGLTVKKTWQGDDNHPNAVYYKILRRAKNGDNYSDWNPVVINNTITQKLPVTVNNNTQWSVTYNDFPLHYGDITYEYKVVETEVNGYITSYEPAVLDPDNDGDTITIINTPKNTTAEIYAEKKWAHTPGDQTPAVTVQLKRRYIESSAQKATVIVKLVDQNDREFAFATINNANVYGELEFNIVPPKSNESPTISITSSGSGSGDPTCTRIVDNIYELKNIRGTTTVTFKYNDVSTGASNTTYPDKPLTYVKYHSFEDNNQQGWTAIDANSTSIETEYNSTNHYLSVNNANQSNWGGAYLSLNGFGLSNNEDYTFVINVKSGSKFSFGFALVQNNMSSLGDGYGTYPKLNTENNLYQFKFKCAYSDWNNSCIKVQANQQEQDNQTLTFGIDNFIILKGDHTNDTITIVDADTIQVNGTKYYSETKANEIASTPISTGSSGGFEDYSNTKIVYDADFWHKKPANEDDWVPFIKNQNIKVNFVSATYEGSPNSHLRVYNVTNGTGVVIAAGRNDTEFVFGNKYRIRAMITGDSGAQGCERVLKLNYKTSENVDGYPELCRVTTNGYNHNNTYNLDYLLDLTPGNALGIPEGAHSFKIYIDTAIRKVTNSDETTSEYHDPFRIYMFRIEEYQKPAVTINPNSITSKLITESNVWREDEDFNSREDTSRTLSSPDNLKTNWKQSNEINLVYEETNGDKKREYEYYVVETKIGDFNVQNQTGIPQSGIYGDYEIKYLRNNGVQSNTEGYPIEITNTYLWYTLPATGGIGVHRIYIAGVGLITAGIFGLIKLRKRERRHE